MENIKLLLNAQLYVIKQTKTFTIKEQLHCALFELDEKNTLSHAVKYSLNY